MSHQPSLKSRGGLFAISAEQHGRLLLGMAKWLLVLNVLDGIFTLIWIEHFGARELNIMMRDLAHGSPMLFMLVKFSLVSLGTLFLWRHRHNPLAAISIVVAFFSYYLVTLLHLQYASAMFL
jgi:hypothetical protein